MAFPLPIRHSISAWVRKDMKQQGLTNQSNCLFLQDTDVGQQKRRGDGAGEQTWPGRGVVVGWVWNIVKNMFKVSFFEWYTPVSNIAMENGPFEDVFPRKKWGYCIAMLVYQRVVQFYSNTSFAGLQQHCLIENSYAEGVVGSTVRSSLVSGRPLGWVVALFWWNFLFKWPQLPETETVGHLQVDTARHFFHRTPIHNGKTRPQSGTLDPNNELHWN